MATISKEKILYFHRESQDPCLTTYLKCKNCKILSYCISRSYYRGTTISIQHFKFVRFVVFEMYLSKMNE